MVRPLFSLRIVAQQGMFQQMLGGRVVQMVVIRLPQQDSEFIPEISANKYALNIRFAIFGDDARPHTSSSNVEFELTLCNL
jgi:cell division protein ZapD